MNFGKKVIMLIFIVITAFAFSACGEKAVTLTPQTTEETIAQVLNNLEEIKSMKSTITTQSDITTGDSNSSISTETKVTTIYSPLSMKIESQSNLNNPIVTYVEEIDDMAITYMEYAGQWMKQTVEPEIALESLRMYDTKQNAILFVENAENWQEIDDNGIIGVFQAVLPADTLASVVEDTKSLQIMGMAGLTEEYYKGVSDTTIVVSIDRQTLLPINYTVDLSNTLETLMNNVVSTFSNDTEDNLMQTKVNNYTLTVDCEDINQTKKVEIPKETLDSAIDFERQIESANISILAEE